MKYRTYALATAVYHLINMATPVYSLEFNLVIPHKDGRVEVIPIVPDKCESQLTNILTSRYKELDIKPEKGEIGNLVDEYCGNIREIIKRTPKPLGDPKTKQSI